MNDIRLEKFIIALSLITVLILHLLIFNHYFSLQEGWWETYAYLVNKGEVINKDFYLAWTPLFVYINAFYQKIFGINFFAFACIGVVAAMIQVILLYLVLREFFSRVSSILGATFASFLWFGMETYIAKDYHTYVFIIEFSTLLFLVKSIKNENSKKGTIYQILGILFLVLLFFIKQNVGLVLFASLFVSYAFISSSVKDYFKRIGFLLLFTIIFFASINFIMPFDPSSITDNDSKGSLWTIATRFIFEPLLFKNLIVAFTIFIFILVLKRYFDCICCIYDKTMMKIMHDVASPIRFAMVGAIFIVLGYFIIHFTSKHIYIGFSISIILFIITMVFIIKNAKIYKSKEYKFMALAITAIVYSGTLTSYALDMNTILLCLSFAFAYILNQNLRNFVRAIFLFWMLFIMALIFYSKLLNPYNWLENYQPSIFRADGEASYPQLKGIKMDKKISEILDFFHEYVGKKSKSDKDFYFFNFPIMYLLNDKIPPYKLMTQWFDVVPTKLANKEYKDFINNPSDNVVLYQYSALAFEVHKRFLQKDHFMQEEFHKTMNEWVKEGKYKFIRSFVVPSYLEYAPKYQKGAIKMEVIIQNSALIGENYKKLKIWLDANGIILEKVKRDGANIYSSDDLDDVSQSISIGDVVVIEGPIKYVFAIFPQIGVMPIDRSGSLNSINIYERVK